MAQPDVSLPLGHNSLGARKGTGAHYTPSELANFVAQRVMEASDLFEARRETSIRVLDPAAGDGQLLISILAISSNRLAGLEVHGFDTDANAVAYATARIHKAHPEARISLLCDDFLEVSLGHSQPTRFDARAGVAFPVEVIIANPPYVRTQVLGSRTAQSLARRFGLSGRVDLYHAFLEGMAEVLRPGGIAGIIVSNRFMTTESGAAIRASILEKFDVLHVWDLGDTKLFEAAVLPAVLLLRRKGGGARWSRAAFTSIYTCNDCRNAERSSSVIEALGTSGRVFLQDGRCFEVVQGTLAHDEDGKGMWRLANELSIDWLATVSSKTFATFASVGDIRVGVKTTADKVFIRSDWALMNSEDRPELLKALTTHHVGRRFRAIQPSNPLQILYTHEIEQGKRVVVTLSQYPKAAKYLESQRAVLEARHYVTDSGRKWYEIWVPQDPDCWRHPKIVFRDISEKPTFWMDLDGTIVNGDCYWVACKDPSKLDLLWLALAVGNSTFVETYYDKQFHNKLYAGRRRFMTQYVEKFPLPDPNMSVCQDVIQLAKQIYDLIPQVETAALEQELDLMVWRAFGLTPEESRG